MTEIDPLRAQILENRRTAQRYADSTIKSAFEQLTEQLNEKNGRKVYITPYPEYNGYGVTIAGPGRVDMEY